MTTPGDGTTRERDKPWIFRTYAGHSAVHESNALYRKNLAKGQTGLFVAFDLPTQTILASSLQAATGIIGSIPISSTGAVVLIIVIDFSERSDPSIGLIMAPDTASSSEVESGNAIKIKYRTAPYVVLTVAVLAPLSMYSILSMTSDASLRDWILAAVCVGGTIYCIWRALDWRPVLVLDENGLRDRRLGLVHLPWSRLRRVEAINESAESSSSGRRCGVALHFDHNVAPSSSNGESLQPTVFINLMTTEIGPAQFLEHVRRYAPHATISTDKLEQ